MGTPRLTPQTAEEFKPSESARLEVLDGGLSNGDAGRLGTNRQFSIWTTLAAYSGVILVGIMHHEPWADEAQAWVLSRDLSYRYLLFHQLAYEGHPPLWPTILWIANHWFHLPYQSIGWIGGLCAVVGCWFFCRYSPFPLWVRLLFPFTYFMAFQYAIVARPYVLLPLCAFATAHFFSDADRHPWRFVGAASALAMVTAPGVMMAAGLALARAWYAFRSWGQIPPAARKQILAAAIVFGLVLALIARVNWPPADRTVATAERRAAAGETGGNFGFRALPSEIATAFFGSPIPSAALLIVVGAWCVFRRRTLVLLLPLLFLLAFFVKVYGSMWHCGAFVLIIVAALWIAWPLPIRRVGNVGWVLNALMLAGAVAFFALNFNWTVRTFARDYSWPYSGSSDAASFLQSVGANRSSTCGFGFHAVALQPYFQKGIFMNWPEGEAFWRQEKGNQSDEDCHGAKWVVVPICCTFEVSKQSIWANDGMLRSHGYFPAHVSRGAMFFEGRGVEPTDFVIYERGQ